jgi:hypothetical protein
MCIQPADAVNVIGAANISGGDWRWRHAKSDAGRNRVKAWLTAG